MGTACIPGLNLYCAHVHINAQLCAAILSKFSLQNGMLCYERYAFKKKEKKKDSWDLK